MVLVQCTTPSLPRDAWRPFLTQMEAAGMVCEVDPTGVRVANPATGACAVFDIFQGVLRVHSGGRRLAGPGDIRRALEWPKEANLFEALLVAPTDRALGRDAE